MGCHAPAAPKLLQDEADIYVNMVVKALPATERTKQKQQHQEKDEVCIQIAVYCYHGWPKEKDIRPYLSIAGELTIENDHLMCGSRIVIPLSTEAGYFEQNTCEMSRHHKMPREGSHVSLCGGLKSLRNRKS